MMNIKERIKYITEQLEDQKKVVRDWEGLLENAVTSIENHVYDSLDDAEDELPHYLSDKAYEDCKGAGNRGNDTYSQDFIVDGKEYVATMIFEYDRHDKTYYYIDSCEYSYEVK